MRLRKPSLALATMIATVAGASLPDGASASNFGLGGRRPTTPEEASSTAPRSRTKARRAQRLDPRTVTCVDRLIKATLECAAACAALTVAALAAAWVGGSDIGEGPNEARN